MDNLPRASLRDFDKGIRALAAFAQAEFFRLQGGYDAGTFFGSVNQVRRYREFLEQIYERHVSTAQSYRAAQATTMDEAKLFEPGKSYPISPAQTSMIALVPKLDLEVQSFYMFAKILLGNVSQMIEMYFGPARNCSLLSHDKFRRALEKYRAAKNHDVRPSFGALLATLQQIVDHRDKEYAHLKPSKRAHTVSPPQVTGDGHIVVGQMPAVYPDMRFPVEIVNSEPLYLLLIRLSEYLAEVVHLLQANQDRTRLAPKRPNPTVQSSA